MAGPSLGVNEHMPILKANRLSTGIQDLDLILEGGYTNPGNVMIMGPSGTEKAALGYHFVASAGLNENAYIVCGNSSPQDIIKKAATLGIRLDNARFIDCYTATLGKGDTQGSEKIKIVHGPGALTDLSLLLNEVIKESTGKKMRVVFDTFSTFVLYNPKEPIRKFLSVVQGRFKGANATGLYLVDEGVHDKQLISMLEQGMDEKYIITDVGGKFTLNLPDIDSPVSFKVGPTGIVIT